MRSRWLFSTVAALVALGAPARAEEPAPAAALGLAQPPAAADDGDEAAAAPGSPAPEREDEPAPTPRFTFGGDADAYYEGNFNRPFSGRNALHYFDYQAGQGPHFNMLHLWADLARQPFGYRIDYIAGPAARLLNVDETLHSDFWEHMEQLLVSLNLERSGRTYVDGGKYGTPAGAEANEAINRIFYGMGLLSNFAVPTFHLGGRVFHYFNDNEYLLLHGFRGTNTVGNPGHGPGFGVTLAKAIGTTTAVTVSYLGGEETDLAGGVPFQHLIDLVAAYDPNERLACVLQADFGTQPNVHVAPGLRQRASYYGAMLIGKYAFRKNQYVAARVEGLHNDAGIVFDRALDAYALTLNYTRFITQRFQTRLEFRHDFTPHDDRFPTDTHGVFTNHQDTLLLATIVSY
jgi:hypothetical protein